MRRLRIILLCAIAMFGVKIGTAQAGEFECNFINGDDCVSSHAGNDILTFQQAGVPNPNLVDSQNRALTHVIEANNVVNKASGRRITWFYKSAAMTGTRLFMRFYIYFPEAARAMMCFHPGNCLKYVSLYSLGKAGDPPPICSVPTPSNECRRWQAHIKMGRFDGTNLHTALPIPPADIGIKESIEPFFHTPDVWHSVEIEFFNEMAGVVHYRVWFDKDSRFNAPNFERIGNFGWPGPGDIGSAVNTVHLNLNYSGFTATQPLTWYATGFRASNSSKIGLLSSGPNGSGDKTPPMPVEGLTVQ